jgi:hypothetical protein
MWFHIKRFLYQALGGAVTMRVRFKLNKGGDISDLYLAVAIADGRLTLAGLDGKVYTEEVFNRLGGRLLNATPYERGMLRQYGWIYRPGPLENP